eukprot:18879-Pelagococcus_subviridis.AAC.3
MSTPSPSRAPRRLALRLRDPPPSAVAAARFRPRGHRPPRRGLAIATLAGPPRARARARPSRPRLRSEPARIRPNSLIVLVVRRRVLGRVLVDVFLLLEMILRLRLRVVVLVPQLEARPRRRRVRVAHEPRRARLPSQHLRDRSTPQVRAIVGRVRGVDRARRRRASRAPRRRDETRRGRGRHRDTRDATATRARGSGCRIELRPEVTTRRIACQRK